MSHGPQAGLIPCVCDCDCPPASNWQTYGWPVVTSVAGTCFGYLLTAEGQTNIPSLLSRCKQPPISLSLRISAVPTDLILRLNLGTTPPAPQPSIPDPIADVQIDQPSQEARIFKRDYSRAGLASTAGQSLVPEPENSM